MTVEAILTRELGIAFLDARKLTTEAKLKLGIVGYPSLDQKNKLVMMAIEIFSQRPEKLQKALKAYKTDLDTVGSLHSATASSMHSVASSTVNMMESEDFSSSETSGSLFVSANAQIIEPVEKSSSAHKVGGIFRASSVKSLLRRR